MVPNEPDSVPVGRGDVGGRRSNCDKSQGIFIDFGAASVSFQVDLEKMIALRMVNNLRIQATKATLADLPRCLRCW